MPKPIAPAPLVIKGLPKPVPVCDQHWAQYKAEASKRSIKITVEIYDGSAPCSICSILLTKFSDG